VNCERVANASRDLRGKAEEGQVVGIHPRRHAFGHPDERSFLGGSQETSVDPRSLPKVGAPGLSQSLGIDLFCKIRK
jgi:hypothetical protein